MAKHEELKELLGLTATVPFDDRINHHATIEDLRLPLIQAFLKEIGSDLLEESAKWRLLIYAGKWLSWTAAMNI